MSRLPSLFVSHGAPTFALYPGTAGQALRDMAARLLEAYGTPRAIVVVSAHWETAEVTVGASEQPATIHDFGGFPEALYEGRPGTVRNPRENHLADCSKTEIT